MDGTEGIRDDNLRLLFAEAAKQDLHERLQAVQTGFTLLAITVLIALSAWVIRLIGAEPLPGAHIIEVLIRFDSSLNFAVSAFLLIAGVLALLSPIVLGVLLIERRRRRRDLGELIDLLKKYDRL